MTIYNIAYKTTYEINGEQKNKWVQVGKLFEWDNGNKSIELEVIPIGFNGNLSVFDQKKKKGNKDEEIPI